MLMICSEFREISYRTVNVNRKLQCFLMSQQILQKAREEVGKTRSNLKLEQTQAITAPSRAIPP